MLCSAAKPPAKPAAKPAAVSADTRKRKRKQAAKKGSNISSHIASSDEEDASVPDTKEDSICVEICYLEGKRKHNFTVKPQGELPENIRQKVKAEDHSIRQLFHPICNIKLTASEVPYPSASRQVYTSAERSKPFSSKVFRFYAWFHDFSDGVKLVIKESPTTPTDWSPTNCYLLQPKKDTLESVDGVTKVQTRLAWLDKSGNVKTKLSTFQGARLIQVTLNGMSIELARSTFFSTETADKKRKESTVKILGKEAKNSVILDMH